MLAGCGVVLSTATVSDPHRLLQAIKSTADRVTLEIFQVRVPADDLQLQGELWQAVDEQRLELSTRDRLVSNGFRAGVLAGPVPDALAHALNLQSEMPEESTERVITEESATPKIVRRVVQLKHREPVSIQASEVEPRVHVLMNSEQGLEGRSYEQAQGVYSLQAEIVRGQQVHVQLIPELQFGEMKTRYVGGDQGMFVMTPSKERRVFEKLKMTATLSAGEMLVVSGIQESAGSLGAVFHSSHHQLGKAEQKLVLIRLLQVPQSEILADASIAN